MSLPYAFRLMLCASVFTLFDCAYAQQVPIVDSPAVPPTSEAEPFEFSGESSVRGKGHSAPYASGSRSNVRSSAGYAGDSSEYAYELQQLQQEVQTLRGQVEELTYQVRRLDKTQKNRYIDLDKRLSSLSVSNSASQQPGAVITSSKAMSTSVAKKNASTGGDGAKGNEKKQYQAAYAFIKQRQFEAAVDAFKNFIKLYPSGYYTPNAFYWLGEVYMALSAPDLKSAKASFLQLVDQYPEHRKVPGALYKLGIIQSKLGNPAVAREYFNRTIELHPNSSAAALAKEYLKRI